MKGIAYPISGAMDPPFYRTYVELLVKAADSRGVGFCGPQLNPIATAIDSAALAKRHDICDARGLSRGRSFHVAERET